MVSVGAIYDLDPDCDGNGTPDSADLAKGARDCNSDGALDACEIAASPGLDKNDDGRLDACSIAYGDFDLSGAIDGGDVAHVLYLWGEVDPEYGDLDGSGEITAFDLSIILERWGPVEF